MDSKLFWSVAEILINLIEVIVIQWYLHRKLGVRRFHLYFLFLGGFFVFAAVTTLNYLQAPDVVRLPANVVCLIIYALVLYKGQLGGRIFQPLLAYVLLGLSDTLTVSLLTIVPNITIELITQSTIYRFQALIASKIVFTSILFFMANRKDVGHIGRPLWLLFLIVPVTSAAILATLIEYEMRLSDSIAFSLLVATLGLFIVNIAILILLQVLSSNARKILNQEMRLQQSDIQTKYFAEVKSTNDSLRGFRHDLNNHLQVLDGYLILEKYDKAKAYLKEIGDFISLTENITDTGHALLDAVIGAKITYARKQNIKAGIQLQVPAALPLSQMDLCTVLGNILDNAIEACQRLPEGPLSRELSLSIDQFAGHLRILLRNTAMLDGKLDPAHMASAKKGPGHGIGLSNTRRVVAAHGGNMQLSYEANQFTVLILLPLNP